MAAGTKFQLFTAHTFPAGSTAPSVIAWMLPFWNTWMSSIATAKDNLHPVHFTGLFSLSNLYAAVPISRISRFYFGSSPPCF